MARFGSGGGKGSVGLFRSFCSASWHARLKPFEACREAVIFRPPLQCYIVVKHNFQEIHAWVEVLASITSHSGRTRERERFIALEFDWCSCPFSGWTESRRQRKRIRRQSTSPTWHSRDTLSPSLSFSNTNHQLHIRTPFSHLLSTHFTRLASFVLRFDLDTFTTCALRIAAGTVE